MVHVRFVGGRVVVERDFHIIGDELRQMFIEERDEKMRVVAEEVDPGLPAACPSSCPHLATCHPAAGPAAVDGRTSHVSAKARRRASAAAAAGS